MNTERDDSPEGGKKKVDPEALKQTLARIGHMFFPHLGNPLMEALSKTVAKLAEEGQLGD